MLPLFAADAMDQELNVETMLAHSHVVMDRHPWVSAFAFQVDEHADHDIIHVLQGLRLPRPDLLFVIDVPVETAFNRCEGRGKYRDRVYKETKDNLSKIRQRYLDIVFTPHPARPNLHGKPQKTWLLDGERETSQIVDAILAEIQSS